MEPFRDLKISDHVGQLMSVSSEYLTSCVLRTFLTSMAGRTSCVPLADITPCIKPTSAISSTHALYMYMRMGATIDPYCAVEYVCDWSAISSTIEIESQVHLRVGD